MSDKILVSNHIGPEGESVDRLYGASASGGQDRLVNKDYTEYKGKIHKKSITCKDLNGDRFRSHVYVTDDNRWFNRAGQPIDKPNNLVEKTVDNSTESVL